MRSGTNAIFPQMTVSGFLWVERSIVSAGMKSSRKMVLGLEKRDLCHEGILG